MTTLKQDVFHGFAKALNAWVSAIVDHYPITDLTEKRVKEMALVIDGEANFTEKDKEGFWQVIYPDGSTIVFQDDLNGE